MRYLRHLSDEKCKHDLVLLNRLIKPLPSQIMCKSLISAGTSPLMKNKKRNKKRSKKSRKEHHGDESFKRLTLKMIGLSNMISLMNLTKHSSIVQPSKMIGTKLGGIDSNISFDCQIAPSMKSLSFVPGMIEQLKPVEIASDKN